ncbi:RHS repeat domain-containing protein [Flavobacterium sp. B183]|uniref:RHS repeat domain-containing protein n=1 Tax=Flavobacterium sp. B183 TaxID=907046 RepID=UPI00201E8A48|nr:RHS repeat domain-containing protein [Flavobacterium sp. B183]URC14573.1 RHS repeat protein [Flavobacterium sp. B183]
MKTKTKKEFWRKIVFFLILLMQNWSFSQDLFKPTKAPNAAEMSKVSANEVSLFTGTPQVAIPLESFDIDGYKLNLALQYSTGGIRVSQKSTNVGLGWYLSAGGSITRNIKGEPDDVIVLREERGKIIEVKGWLHSKANVRDLNLFNFHQTTGTTNYTDFSNKLNPFYVTNGDYDIFPRTDSQPDIFEFNFNGKSGKFIFDNVNGAISVHQVPWMGLKIEYKMGKETSGGRDYYNIDSFVITDTDNTKYYFEAFEITNDIMDTWQLCYNPGVADDTGLGVGPRGWERAGGQYISHTRSAWHLSKVVTSNQNVVNFEYEEEMIHFKPLGMQTGSQHHEKYWEPEIFYASRSQGTTMVLKRLSKIYLPNTIVEFKSEQNKLPIDENRGKALEEINVYNSLAGMLVKKIGLNYGFSISDGIESAKTAEKPGYRRMILKEVKRYYNPANLTQFSSHKFQYNLKDFGENATQKLPQMNSFATDLWGFYNGANQNTTLIPKMYVYPAFPGSDSFRVEKLNLYTGTEFIFEGANRSPAANFMGIGMLNKISYPTGGSTVYEYEPNEYIDRGETFLGPGLRIKKITTNDGKKDESFLYEYKDKQGKTSGRIIGKPMMARMLSHFTNYQEYNFNYYRANLSRFSDSQMEFNSIDNRLIGYGVVSEIRPGNGKTVSTYSNNGTIDVGTDIHVDDDGPCTNPFSIGYCDGLFEPPMIHHLSYGNHNDSYRLSAFALDLPVKNTFPFPPSPNYDWNRGHLLSKEVFDQQNRKLKRTVTLYQNYAPGLKHGTKEPHNVYGLKMAEITLGRPGDYATEGYKHGISLRASKYKIITDIVKVVAATIDSTYFPMSSLPPLVKRINYSYDSRFHKFPSTISTRNSKNEDIVQEYKYAPDLWNDADPNAAIFEEMENRNMIANPIIIREKVNNLYVAETYNQYSVLNNLILKSAEHKKKGKDINPSSNVDRKIKYDKYDSKGNLLQFSTENGIPTAIVWGYGDKHPVLKVQGITHSELIKKIDFTLNEEINDGSLSANSLDFLRTALPNTMVTIYTYIPLVGVSSITDPNGNITYYQYDTYGRLETVKDKEGNLISENKYHYKN